MLRLQKERIAKVCRDAVAAMHADADVQRLAHAKRAEEEKAMAAARLEKQRRRKQQQQQQQGGESNDSVGGAAIDATLFPADVQADEDESWL